MAWIGVADREALQVRPVASHGDVRGFFDSAPLALTNARAKGQGFAWRTIREKSAVISNDIQNDPQTHMKEQCFERGINSLAFLPLIVEDKGIGVLALYAKEAGFFDEEEMKLLLELAGDISFALDHIEKEERLDYLAFYDSLTGLANRTLFQERVAQYIREASAAPQRGVAVLLVDIDRFKTINDTLGRQAGDQVLRRVAENLVRFTGEPGRLARISADRFAVAIPDAA